MPSLTLFGTTFLTIISLYLSFASPTPESKSGIGARESLNASAAAIYRPADQLCVSPVVWAARICYNPNGGDTGWADLCHNNPGAEDPFIILQGSCEPEEWCQPDRVQDEDDVEPRYTITCVPRTNRNHVIGHGRQYGALVVRNDVGSAAHQSVSVPLNANIRGATVGAIMEGTYQ